MRSKFLQNTSQGFTLIELILYVGLSAIFLTLVTLFLASLVNGRIKSETIAEVEQQGFQAMQRITQTIRNAEGVNSPTIGLSATSLSLDVVIVALDPTIFDSTGSALQITEGGGSSVVLTNDLVTVSELIFENVSRVGAPDIIRVQFTLTRVNAAGRNEYNYDRTFTTSAGLRL